MKDKLKQIIETFGITNQLKKLNEECYELIEAIRDYEDTGTIKLGYREDFIEELADVLNLLNQFKVYYNVNDNELIEAIEYKVDRTIERIESGYYK